MYFASRDFDSVDLFKKFPGDSGGWPGLGSTGPDLFLLYYLLLQTKGWKRSGSPSMMGCSKDRTCTYEKERIMTVKKEGSGWV